MKTTENQFDIIFHLFFWPFMVAFVLYVAAHITLAVQRGLLPIQ